MSRKKAFDRDTVLEKAMHLFWQKGYEATSIEDLVQGMGINRGSLYDTFGDKHRLFLDAIAHYDHTVVSHAIAQLEAPHAGKQAIVDYFQNLIACAADGQRRGCLLTNVAVECCPHDSEAVHRVTANLKRTETAFRTALTTAQANGDLSPHQDVNALARFLTANLQGIRVMSNVNSDRQALQDMVDITLSVLHR
ncbi:TetR/AcrR family transcriptional regulator [Oculatella sp. LEGE 06141]|uniref:TetR/AcrR family transcriptional regulator n=1 Tax=Oculatella sp. LEGE 06141 TaxID=1828648 RepID=UPI001880EC15|nr:TetR/AcrR family transcriptional regulator [Oculatella sp. LEGE 06141]MBE9180990.1 TetR/AcrR family transcriptional regulator [Oculatella sp. LEGE 06141]